MGAARVLTGVLADCVPWTKKEDAIVRARYLEESAKKIASELNRTVNAVHKRARRLGVLKYRAWSPADDARLRDLWGQFTLPVVARRIGRTVITTYWRARKLGLGIGAPQGLEYLTTAADRTGYDVGQLRRILKAHGVRIMPSISRPTGTRRHFHVVDPLDVDDAVRAWNDTETLESAAIRRGVKGGMLRFWLTRYRAAGFDVPEPPAWKQHWRLPSPVFDAVLEWRDGFETASEAARRHGLTRQRMVALLTKAGVERASVKPWYVRKEEVDRVVREYGVGRG